MLRVNLSNSLDFGPDNCTQNFDGLLTADTKTCRLPSRVGSSFSTVGCLLVTSGTTVVDVNDANDRDADDSFDGCLSRLL